MNGLLGQSQHPPLGHFRCCGQVAAGQRLTMSSRISTFSRRRLFSSSSCWFRLRKRCISLRSPVKLPDSGRQDRGQNMDCQPTCGCFRSKQAELRPTCHPLAIFKLEALASEVHGGDAILQAQLNLTGRSIQLQGEDHTQHFTEIQSQPLVSHFLVTGIPMEAAGPTGPGA